MLVGFTGGAFLASLEVEISLKTSCTLLSYNLPKPLLIGLLSLRDRSHAVGVSVGIRYCMIAVF